jgi:hypothetical protein
MTMKEDHEKPEDRAPDLFRSSRFILTDMDEPLTYQGRLAASTYTAAERLCDAEVKSYRYLRHRPAGVTK